MQMPPDGADLVHALLQRAQHAERALHAEREEVAAARGDLHARHDPDPVAAPQGVFAGAQPGGDLVVVGDRDQVEVGLRLGPVDDRLGGVEAIGVGGVDMEIGLAQCPVRHPALTVAPPRSIARISPIHDPIPDPCGQH